MIAPPALAGLIGQNVRTKWYFVPIIYAVYCAAAMLSLLFIPETRNIRLEDIDQTTSLTLGPGTLTSRPVHISPHVLT